MSHSHTTALRKHTSASWRFAGKFIGYWCAGLLLCAWFPSIGQVTIAGTQHSLVALLQVLGLSPSIAGDLVSTGSVRVRIVLECTPLLAAQVLFAAILSFPAKWSNRAAGLCIGAGTLWAVNVLRIVTLMAILWLSPKHFEVVHTGVWQAVLLITVAGVFVAWVRWTETEHPSSTSLDQ